jgi:hypothetical protein
VYHSASRDDDDDEKKKKSHCIPLKCMMGTIIHIVTTKLANVIT